MLEIIIPIIGFCILFSIGFLLTFKTVFMLRFLARIWQPMLNFGGWDKTKNNKSRVMARVFGVPKNDQIHVMEDYVKYRRFVLYGKFCGICFMVGTVILTIIYFKTQV